MPADYSGKACRFRIEIHSIRIMNNVKKDSAQLDHFRFRKFPRPCLSIHIAADRRYRRNLFQFGMISGAPISPA